MDLLVGNLAYVLIACSYLVRDMLALRTLSVIASVASITFSLQRQVYLIVGWNLLFITVNAIQLARLIYERRPVVFPPEEQEVYEGTFAGMGPADFSRLIELARWETREPGDEILTQGEPVTALTLLFRGRATVEVDGRPVAQVKEGGFMGEMGFLTGAPASATVRAARASTLLAWDAKALAELLGGSPALTGQMQAVLGRDLIRKLRRADGLRTSAGTVSLAELEAAGGGDPRG